MNMRTKIILSIGGSFAILAVLGWVGTSIPPKIVRPTTQKSQAHGGVHLSENLPDPVRRYLQVALGDNALRTAQTA